MFSDIVNDELHIRADVLPPEGSICVPVYSVRDDWIFDEPAGRAYNLVDEAVAPFIGIMLRVPPEGSWIRESLFDDNPASVSTAQRRDLIDARRLTYSSAWVWLAADRRVIFLSAPGSDLHVICMSVNVVYSFASASEILASLRATMQTVIALRPGPERAAYVDIIEYYLGLSAQMGGFNFPQIVRDLRSKTS